MKAFEIVNIIESFAPPGIQESWDNCGLITGDRNAEIKGILLCLDITDPVIDEAMDLGCNMIVSHHPLVFSGLKRFTGDDMVSRVVRTAIKNDLLIYSAHTNLDQVQGGVSFAIAEKLELVETEVLVPRKSDLIKLVTFVPENNLEKVSSAVFAAGAGHIGNYDSCGYSSNGIGSFRAGDGTEPFTGEKGQLNFESEKRFETIFPKYLESKVIGSLLKAHPYEEVAYDLYPLNNENPYMGLGVVGNLEDAVTEAELLSRVKHLFNTGCIRYTPFLNKDVRRIAVLGGSGSEFIGQALSKGADAYITADIKYHQFFMADNKIMLLDIGHYESEHLVLEVINKLLLKKLTNFAVHLSKISTNPINYF